MMMDQVLDEKSQAAYLDEMDQVQNESPQPAYLDETGETQEESAIAYQGKEQPSKSQRNWYRLVAAIVLLFIALCTFMALYFVEVNRKVDEKASVNDTNASADEDTITESPTQSPTEKTDPIEDSSNPFHGSPKQARLYSAIAPAVASPYFYMANHTSVSEYRAWKWLSEEDFSEDTLDEYSTPAWKIVERYAIAVFYYATNGQGWINQYNFLSDSSVCDWHDESSTFHFGVRFCTDDGSVTMLQLPSNNLEGSLPTILGLLSNLSSLDLPDNLVKGTIPSEIFKLSALSGRLDLSYNRLTGTIPEPIGSLTDLNELLLQYNRLDGTIPDGILALTSLTSINLGTNLLIGSIPGNIGSLSLLLHLRLNDNLLTGSIPSSIGMLRRLHKLQLQQNRLTGGIPTSLSNLKNIDAHTFNLYLHSNNFTSGSSMEFLCQENGICKTRMGCSSDCFLPEDVECSCCRKCFARGLNLCAKVSPSLDGCRMIMDDNLNQKSSLIQAKNPVEDSDPWLIYDTNFPFVVTDKINIDSEDSAYSVYGLIRVDGGPITYNPRIGVPDVTCHELMTDDWYAMKDDSQLRFMEVPGYPCTEFGKRIIYRLIMEWLYFG